MTTATRLTLWRARDETGRDMPPSALRTPPGHPDRLRDSV